MCWLSNPGLRVLFRRDQVAVLGSQTMDGFSGHRWASTPAWRCRRRRRASLGVTCFLQQNPKMRKNGRAFADAPPGDNQAEVRF